MEQAEETFNNDIDKDRNDIQTKYNNTMKAIRNKASEGMINMQKEYLEGRLIEIQKKRHKIAQPILIRAALTADKDLLTPKYRQELKNR